MRAKIQFSILLGAITVLSSCSNYGYISENDVYIQAPTEINLEEDENDLTSFNAFRAREKGAFTQNYKDPRANETMRFNQMSIMASYMPFGVIHGRYTNVPIAFHGMGYSPFHSPSFYTGYGMGLRAMYGNQFGNYYAYGPYGYGSGFGYDPYYGGYYGNSYYGNGYYGGGYYGGGYYNGIQHQSNPEPSQPVHYGNRSSLTSSSNRSSSYQNTYYQKSAQPTKSAYDVNDQTLGTSRRDVQKRYAGSGDYSNNGQPNKSKSTVGNTSGSSNMGVSHQRAVNQNYTPNSSARRSGAVQSQRSVEMSGSSARGVNSSSQRPASYPAQARPQARGSFSVGGSTGNVQRNTSSPSTPRSSGSTNSNSGRR
ncbi:MAG TPA: hypothetical protein VKY37_06235 [Brumimicrobium sp.]|nr:hypothetical protein [Brumimicrobium sp.]